MQTHFHVDGVVWNQSYCTTNVNLWTTCDPTNEAVRDTQTKPIQIIHTHTAAWCLLRWRDRKQNRYFLPFTLLLIDYLCVTTPFELAIWASGRPLERDRTGTQKPDTSPWKMSKRGPLPCLHATKVQTKINTVTNRCFRLFVLVVCPGDSACKAPPSVLGVDLGGVHRKFVGQAIPLPPLSLAIMFIKECDGKCALPEINPVSRSASRHQQRC